jgi:hypothetical protein
LNLSDTLLLTQRLSRSPKEKSSTDNCSYKLHYPT